MKLYDGNGNIIDVSDADNTSLKGIASAAKTYTPYGIRSNIALAMGYTNAGTERWMEAGLKFKRTSDSITEFTFSYSIEIDGEASKVQIKCYGSDSVSATHDYTGGEMAFTDTFSNANKLNSEYIYLYPTISTINVDDKTYIGTRFTLKIAEIPEGLELIGVYVKRAPTLTINSLTFDESPTYQR